MAFGLRGRAVLIHTRTFVNAPRAQPTSPSPASRWVLFAACGLLVVAAVAAYTNSFSLPFVFDDVPAIAENPTIRHLPSIGEALHPPSANGVTVGGRPLLNLSFALNYAISGNAVWSYHALNLVIHLLAGLTLFGIVRRTLAVVGRVIPSPPPMIPTAPNRRVKDNAPYLIAFAAALLWTLHPLQTESVTYTVQRAESLAGLFYLLTLYGFIRASASPAPGKWYPLSLSACLLGMATKEVMASAPLIVLLYDRTFVGGSFRAAWRRRWFYLGLALTWLLLAYLIVRTGSRGGTAGFGLDAPWWAYALTQCRVVPHYLRLSLWPHPLIFDHGIELVKNPWVAAPYTLLLALLVAATVIALWRRPAVGFLGAWFFLILAPSSSIVPVATQTMAEHRMYLPLAAVLTAIVTAIHALTGRGSLLLFLALASGLGWLTLRRNTDYRSELILWGDTVAKLPDNVRARCNLGVALFQAARLPEAIAQYEAALQVKPDSFEARNNLGSALYQSGRVPEAEAQFREALRIEPRSAKAHCNLGTLLMRFGRTPEAVAEYEEALRVDPEYADAHNNLGNVFFQLGRLPEATVQYELALRSRPDMAEAHNNLGSVLLELGRMAEARQHYEEALRLRPDYAKAQENLRRLQDGTSLAHPSR